MKQKKTSGKHFMPPKMTGGAEAKTARPKPGGKKLLPEKMKAGEAKRAWRKA